MQVLLENDFVKKIAYYSVIFIAFCFLVFVLINFSVVFKPLALSLLLLAALAPFVRKGVSNLEKYLRIIFIFVLILGFTFTASYFVSQEFQAYLKDINLTSKIEKFDLQFLKEFDFSGSIVAIVESFSTIVSQVVLTLIILVFITPSYTRIVNGKSKFQKTILKIEEKIKIYIKTKCLISFISAIIVGLILFLFGKKLILTLMFLAFILNFIPNIGSIILVAVIALLHILEKGIDVSLVALIIILVIADSILGSIIDPKLSAHNLKVPAIFVLASLLFWGSIWGIAGALISVPLTISIKIILESFLSTKKLKEEVT